MFKNTLERIVLAIEAFAAIALLALALIAIWIFGAQFIELITGELVSVDPLADSVRTILEIFILIELFRIAVAYMQHKNVIPTVLEAALVAVARKFVAFEPHGNPLYYAGALAVLLLAVAVSWFLLSRSNACECGLDEA